MAIILTDQELINAKRDIDDIGKAVNKKEVVHPRYGDSFKSLPMIVDEFQISSDAAEAAAVSAAESANIAQSSSQIAQSSANIAEAAATAATIGGKVYATPADGVDPVTGVADGDYFNVRSTNDESYVDEYQNVGGVATPTGKSYLSAIGVQLQEKAASTVIDASGKTQQEINNQIKTPLFVNADNTGSIDTTSQLASLLDPDGKYVINLTKGTYLVDSLVIPDNTIVYGNGAIIKRGSHTNSPTVVVGENSVIFGLKVDGNKSVLGTYGLIARGIELRRNSSAIFCESYNNVRHGFYAMNEDLMVFDPPSDNQKMLFCKAYDNGFNPGGAGTGDGFSAMNSSNVLYLGCEAWNNARTGFVATTYDRNTTHTDKSYSSGVRAVNCKAWGNGYSSLNFEGVTNGGAIGGEYDSITYSFSDEGVFSDAVVGHFYAQDSDYISVNNVRVNSELTANNSFFITGKTPLVNNVRVTVGDSANITSSSVTVLIEASDGLGSVSNIHLNRAYFGIRLKVANAINLTVEEATVAKIQIRRGSEASLAVNEFIKLSNGSLEFSSNSIPTTGYAQVGDIIRSTSRYSLGEIGWVCITSGTGTAAKWAPFGNVGGVPSQASFLSGTAASSYNANDFTAGTSYYASSGDTKTYTNFPFDLVDNRLIINTSHNSASNQGWLQQEAISVLSNKRARRIKGYSGSWTAWELF